MTEFVELTNKARARMKRERIQLGLSYGDLAKLSGVSKSSISAFEKGTRTMSDGKRDQVFRALESVKSRNRAFVTQAREG